MRPVTGPPRSHPLPDREHGPGRDHRVRAEARDRGGGIPGGEEGAGDHPAPRLLAHHRVSGARGHRAGGAPADRGSGPKGSDKQLVGQVAAEIRGFRPPEPYKGKGVGMPVSRSAARPARPPGPEEPGESREQAEAFRDQEEPSSPADPPSLPGAEQGPWHGGAPPAGGVPVQPEHRGPARRRRCRSHARGALHGGRGLRGFEAEGKNRKVEHAFAAGKLLGERPGRQASSPWCSTAAATGTTAG
jgi:hypothetical protein